MANTPVIGRMKLTSGNYVYFKDIDARSDISTLQGDVSALQSAVDQLNSFEYTVCTNAANTPAGVKWGSPQITGTLVASADTMYKIYLVPSENAQGDVYDEYITVKNGTTYSWEKLGDTSVNLDALGEMAYCDTASVSYTPAGSVEQPTFTGDSQTVTVKNSGAVAVTISKATGGTANYTPEGTVSQPTFTGTAGSLEGTATISASSVQITIDADQEMGPNYTPAGTVTQPTFSGTAKSIKGAFSGTQGSVSVSGTPNGSVSLATGTGTGFTTITPAGSITVGADKTGGQVVKTVTGSTGSIATFGSAGTLPTLTTSVGTGDDAETLIFTFSQGTLPSAGSATVVTGVSSTTGDLSFSGTAAGIKATFSGSATTSTGNFTPAGSVSLSAGAGTGSVDVTPAGTVSQPTFTGEQVTFGASVTDDLVGTLAGQFTPEGTVSQPTFTGTGAHLDGSVAAQAITSTGTFKATGTVSKPGFTGTAATITVTPDD